MKLKTKLTALCAALLLAVAVSLTAAMLWQVREQSYGALFGSTEETLNDLVDDFGTAVYRSSTDGLDSLSRKVLLTYCFRSCSVPGSALVVNGECLSASAQIDPERYLDVRYGGTQSARACAGGRHFLILGRVTDAWGMDCSVYLAADATYIYSQLWQLSGRFALLALSIGLLGLGAVYWMISRTLSPLSRLSEAAGSIADGNYSQRVPVVSQDEVGTLAGNFNRMALAVETHVDTLREQNERQKLFVGAVTHELKTPLTVILTNAELLQEPEYDEQARSRFVDSIMTMSHQMRGLVESLLELARVDNGGQNMVFSRLNFSELVSDALLPFEPVYFEKGLTLESNVEENLFVRGSQQHLKQVADILLDNAAKYASADSTVRVILRRQGSHCLLSVASAGDAISKEDLKNIFKRFYRMDKARSMNHSYGLGLSIADSIVSKHGGKIWAESADGVNAFFVQLPTA